MALSSLEVIKYPAAAAAAAFTSHPSDLELVNSYLRPFVDTGVKAGAFIHEADVYTADPKEFTKLFAPAVAQDGEQAWYFFSPLRHKAARDNRKVRTVATGEGCWHNEAKYKPIVDAFAKETVGYRQSFSFVTRDGLARVRTGWIMMEIKLHADADHGRHHRDRAQEPASAPRIVLCKVYRSTRHPDYKAEMARLKAEAEGENRSSAVVALLKAEAEDDNRSSEAAAAAAAVAIVVAPEPNGSANGDQSSDASPPAAASGRKRKSALDESSLATVATPKRQRKTQDAESSGAASEASPARKMKGGDAPSASVTKVLCPNCSFHFHLVATAADVAPARFTSETETGKDEAAPAASNAPHATEAGDPSNKESPFLTFL